MHCFRYCLTCGFVAFYSDLDVAFDAGIEYNARRQRSTLLERGSIGIGFARVGILYRAFVLVSFLCVNGWKCTLILVCLFLYL